MGRVPDTNVGYRVTVLAAVSDRDGVGVYAGHYENGISGMDVGAAVTDSLPGVFLAESVTVVVAFWIDEVLPEFLYGTNVGG